MRIVLFTLSIIALLVGFLLGEIHTAIISATMLFVGATIVEQLTLIRKEIKNNFNKKS